MNSSSSVPIVVGLVLASIALGRLGRRGGKRRLFTVLQLLLSLAAVIVALWAAWRTIQEH